MNEQGMLVSARGLLAFLLLWVALVVAPVSLSLAGPTIIRDQMVQDLNVTPVLGRGYSIATNTMQSTCLTDVVLTDPSYNFQYDYFELSASSASSQTKASSSMTTKSRRWAWTSKKSTSVKKRSKTASKQKSYKTYVANMKTFTYYASVDESQTKLADSAVSLLKKQDFPGFFSACGPYYIRGINRIGEFTSLLIFKSSMNSSSDAQFASHAETAVRGWGSASSSSSAQATAFMEMAMEKEMKIKSKGWGLAKNMRGKQTLISNDIPSFKQAISAAFRAMQSPMSGMVHSMEVVPWTANIEFQDNTDIRGKDIIDDQEVPLYKKKDILIRNAEFMTTLWQVARAKLNNYYKAVVCEQSMKARFYRSGVLVKAFADATLKNHRTEENEVPPYTLKTLKQELSKETRKLLQGYRKYMYTGSSNAERCVRDILRDPIATTLSIAAMQAAKKAAGPEGGGMASFIQGQQVRDKAAALGRGLYLKPYFEHKSCQKMQEIAADGAIMPLGLDDHCMPQLPGETVMDGAGLNVSQRTPPKSGGVEKALDTLK